MNREEYEEFKRTGVRPKSAKESRTLREWARTPRGLLVLGAGVLIILAALAGKGRRPASDDDPIDGWSSCRRQVVAQLKAPSTAKFTAPSGRKDPERRVGVITAAVDAQNSFGATIRTSFTCTLRKDGGTWVADQVTFMK
jgi:hypothetical protein